MKTALFGFLGYRLFDLQVTQAERFAVLADENRIRMRSIPMRRGRILDRSDVPLSDNVPRYALLATPEEIEDPEALAASLAALVRLEADDAAAAIRGTYPPFKSAELLADMTFDEMSMVAVRLPELPGVRIEQRERRVYPLGPSAGHVTGYVGRPADVEDADEANALEAGVLVGRSGLEQLLERQLLGTPGMERVEVNAKGRPVRSSIDQPPIPGFDVRTTIDAGLQRYASDRLAAERAATAVVLDVADGGVLAFASQPGYDPNAFADGISPAEWKPLNENVDSPLLPRPIAGVYAPGSTFKMIVLMAALDAGVIDYGHEVNCPGYFVLGGSRFHCWRRGGHGRVNIRGSLKYSCDVFYYEIGGRVGIDAIRAMAKRFGLDDSAKTGLPGERHGTVPDAAWKLARIGEEWRPGETTVAAIGQGYVSATPMQLAVMAARLATNRAVVPTFMLGAPSPAEPIIRDLPILEAATDGMWAVVNETDGTAYGARIGDPGRAMSGKTGTSQVRRISATERAGGVIANADLEWEQRDHALFVAFAPAAAPRFACSVVIEHGGSGSGAAGPVARDILREAQRLMPGGGRHHHLVASAPEPADAAAG